MNPDHLLMLVLYALVWSAWCLLHSLLISGPVADLLDHWCGRASRLVYNLIAILTLLPLIIWEHSLSAGHVVTWPQMLWPLRMAMLLLALWLLVSAARSFKLGDFFGFSALHSSRQQPGEPHELICSGILAKVRHPWYSAGLLLLWLRNHNEYELVTSVVLSLYLIIGAHVEERRLFRRFGSAYADYKRRVPMFVPRFISRQS